MSVEELPDADAVEDEGKRRTVVVGLLADPGLPSSIAERLAGELPDVFAQGVDRGISWEVRVLTRALPLDEAGNVEAWQHSDALMKENGWDLMVCLTELTRRLGDRFFVFDLELARGVALISLPALGPVRLRHHVRSTLVRVVRTLVDDDVDPRRQAAQAQRMRPLRRLTGALGGRTERQVTDSEEGPNSYVALSGRGASARLIGGMVRLNQPWRLVPGLDNAIAAAAATAAFGIFYSSIWAMSDALGPLRLTLISLVAMAGMVCWLILHNGLWQREAPDTTSSRSPLVYNLSTVVTVAIGVLCMYLVLLAIVVLGTLTVIPFSYMAKTLGHDAGIGDYLALGWFISSMGTFAGALGSTFESDEAIQQATYARRERERHNVARREAAHSS